MTLLSPPLQCKHLLLLAAAGQTAPAPAPAPCPCLGWAVQKDVKSPLPLPSSPSNCVFLGGPQSPRASPCRGRWSPPARTPQRSRSSGKGSLSTSASWWPPSSPCLASPSRCSKVSWEPDGGGRGGQTCHHLLPPLPSSLPAPCSREGVSRGREDPPPPPLHGGFRCSGLPQSPRSSLRRSHVPGWGGRGTPCLGHHMPTALSPPDGDLSLSPPRGGQQQGGGGPRSGDCPACPAREQHVQGR